MVTICFKAGQPIFIAAEKAKGVYRVKNGKVKKSALTSFGAQHIFYICKENEYLGYHAVLSQELYADCAIALSDCEVDFIAEKDFFFKLLPSILFKRKIFFFFFF